MTSPLADRLIRFVSRRPPDKIIGDGATPYLLRWYIIPRNPLFNVYLHLFLRSDDDRALHCHPWVNCSIILRGRYFEHTEHDGEPRIRLYTAGDWRLRPSGRIRHRIELIDNRVWTLFITGPRYREWGFYCPQGFVHWTKFTDPSDSGKIGKGCNQ